MKVLGKVKQIKQTANVKILVFLEMLEQLLHVLVLGFRLKLGWQKDNTHIF